MVKHSNTSPSRIFTFSKELNINGVEEEFEESASEPSKKKGRKLEMSPKPKLKRQSDILKNSPPQLIQTKSIPNVVSVDLKSSPRSKTKVIAKKLLA